MNEFYTKNGPQLTEQDLKDIFALDEVVYTKDATEIEDMVGVIDNMLVRHSFCNDNFVAVFENQSGKLVGYINYLNITPALLEEVMNARDGFPDDDILPDRLQPYNTQENHLFIISVAIYEEFRDTGAVKVLSGDWLQELRSKQQAGYPITDITACTISPDGEKFSRIHGFRLHHRLEDSREALYICDGALITSLLDKEPYHSN
ncbi:MAG: hypothetical protein HUJ69_00230 [Lachnospiraceae bacterium]|nr:hypothetical protein [Lachnospiraceae bacterium]